LLQGVLFCAAPGAPCGYKNSKVLVPVSWIKTTVILTAVLSSLWLFQLWQPARQVELRTLNLLQRASINEARLLFSHFFALQITATGPWQFSGGEGEWTASGSLGVFGSGSPVAHAVIEEVRAAQGKFEFRWQKSGGWPWAWLLTEVRHEDLAARHRS